MQPLTTILALGKASVCILFFCLSSAQAKVSVAKDVPYLGPGRTEKMDIYTPAVASTPVLPAVLLIHGGGWIGGDKADKRGVSISTELSEQGYVVFAINYALAQKNAGFGTPGAFPQNLFDCKSALRFIRQMAAQYHVDPKHIGIMGESAGAHLALLVGTTSHIGALNHGGLYRKQDSGVSCIVDMYGIPDLMDSSMSFIKAPFQGLDEAGGEKNLRLANPMRYLSRSTPAVLVIHGSADTLVPIQQSRRLVSQLENLGVPHEYVEVKDAVHGFNLHPDQMDLRPVVFAFLGKYLKGPSHQ